MTTKKIIPLKAVQADSLDDLDARHERLQNAGYLPLMQMSEPRLSELVAKYRAKGYDVEVLPLLDEGDLANATSGSSCGSGSCSSAGDCSSGGCGSTQAPVSGSSLRHKIPRQAVPGVGTLYVRMRASAAVQT